MAKLYFYYSAMNSGKTTMLLQAEFNYDERNMKTVIFIPYIVGNDVRSRIGIKKEAISFNENFDFYLYLKDKHYINCVFIDEAQFLNKKQVIELCRVVDKLGTPVLCYGLRTDFKGELFEGSKYLLSYADKLIELKTICYCGKKAIMNMRKKSNEESNAFVPVLEGDQIEIGGNDKYISLCRKCYYLIVDGIKK